MPRIEPMSDKVWMVRASTLADLMNVPMPPDQVLAEAKKWLKWANWLTIQVLAAGEGTKFCFMDGKWRRPPR